MNTIENPNNAFEQEISSRINRGIVYLQKNIETDGLCREYESEKIGVSDSWITTCVGAALAEFDAVPDRMVSAVINLQDKRGGWGWNDQVPSDADATLRALKFLRKAGENDTVLFARAETFVLAHQQEDGGIATFLHEDVRKTKNDIVGWADSHPEVSAFALKYVTNPQIRKKVEAYLIQHIQDFGYASFWWDTPQYLGRDLGIQEDLPVDQSDALDISLDLLRKAKNGMRDEKEIEALFRMQELDGQFPPTSKLTFPDHTNPAKAVMAGLVVPRGRVIPDNKGLLTTPISIVALHKQKQI